MEPGVLGQNESGGSRSFLAGVLSQNESGGSRSILPGVLGQNESGVDKVFTNLAQAAHFQASASGSNSNQREWLTFKAA